MQPIKIRRALTASVFAAALVLTPAAQADDATTWEALDDWVAESWESFQDATEDEREAAIAAGDALLEDLDRRIEALDVRAEQASDEAHTDWDAQRGQLVERREAIARDVDELRAAEGDRFDALVEAVRGAYEETVSALQDAWNWLTS